MAGFFARTGMRDWLFAYVGAVAVWLVTVMIADGFGAMQTLTAGLGFAVFYVLVATGQMFVIATGPGNIDLSIPATVTLGAGVAMSVMAGSDAMIVPGFLAAIATGIAVGSFNYALIRLLRIPPIIATLSSSFIVQSTAIWYGRGLSIKPPDALQDFTFARLQGVPVMALCAVLFTLAMAVVLRRTVYGRSVLAIGQNPKAAHLAGVDVERTRWITYTLSAALAGFTGALFAGFSGGVSLDMGAQFLLASIAVVVIGGTSVAGGKANLPGLWGAAMFLFLLVTMLNAAGVGSGVRQLMTGILIIAVITAAGGEKRGR
jgi:ribose transport system permease protein